MDCPVVLLRAIQPTDDEGKGSQLPVSNSFLLLFIQNITGQNLYQNMSQLALGKSSGQQTSKTNKQQLYCLFQNLILLLCQNLCLVTHLRASFPFQRSSLSRIISSILINGFVGEKITTKPKKKRPSHLKLP